MPGDWRPGGRVRGSHRRLVPPSLWLSAHAYEGVGRGTSRLPPSRVLPLIAGRTRTLARTCRRGRRTNGPFLGPKAPPPTVPCQGRVAVVQHPSGTVARGR